MTRAEAIAAGAIVPGDGQYFRGQRFAPLAERIFLHNPAEYIERLILDESVPYDVRAQLWALAEAARAGKGRAA